MGNDCNAEKRSSTVHAVRISFRDAGRLKGGEKGICMCISSQEGKGELRLDTQQVSFLILEKLKEIKRTSCKYIGLLFMAGRDWRQR